MNIKDVIEFQEEKYKKRFIFKVGQDSLLVLNFEPHQFLPPHKHPGLNLYLLVLEGEGTFTIDGKNIEAKKDDWIYAEGEENFSFKNGSKRTSLYVVLSEIHVEN